MPRYIQPPEPGSQRYSPAERQRVLDFVLRWPLEERADGIAAASAEFGVSKFTVRKWVRANSPALVDLERLQSLEKQITRLKAELAALRPERQRLVRLVRG